MIKLDAESKRQLIETLEKRKVAIEGNILKIFDTEGDSEFQEYIDSAIERDKDIRRKRLEMTKKIQSQNNELEKTKNELSDSLKKTQDSVDELIKSKLEADKLREEAEKAKQLAENAKAQAENDLDILQKRTQNELTGKIVKVALWVVIGVGVLTTVVYLISLFLGKDTQIIGSTWSNMLGILLTNAFSILGTIMGVKYANGDKQK
jgi:hypothetical protein